MLYYTGRKATPEKSTWPLQKQYSGYGFMCIRTLSENTEKPGYEENTLGFQDDEFTTT